MLELIRSIVGFVNLWCVILYYWWEQSWIYSATVAISGWVNMGCAIWMHDHFDTGISAFVGAVWTWMAYNDWKNRRKRKRRRLAIWAGYKGRALLAKLTDSMPKPQLPERARA